MLFIMHELDILLELVILSVACIPAGGLQVESCAIRPAEVSMGQPFNITFVFDINVGEHQIAFNIDRYSQGSESHREAVFDYLWVNGEQSASVYTGYYWNNITTNQVTIQVLSASNLHLGRYAIRGLEFKTPSDCIIRFTQPSTGLIKGPVQKAPINADKDQNEDSPLMLIVGTVAALVVAMIVGFLLFFLRTKERSPKRKRLQHSTRERHDSLRRLEADNDAKKNVIENKRSSLLLDDKDTNNKLFEKLLKMEEGGAVT